MILSILFFMLLVALFVASLFTIKSLSCQGSDSLQKKDDVLKLNKERISELEKRLDEMDRIGADKVSQLEEIIKTLKDQIAKLNKDLSLKDQMYEGLKAQYNELEKTFEERMQKAEVKFQATDQKSQINPSV